MSSDSNKEDKIQISRDFIISWLFPPVLAEYEKKIPESIDIFITNGIIKIRDKRLSNLINDFKLMSNTIPKFIRYNKGAGGVHVFKFLGRLRYRFHNSCLLSRLARSKRKFLASWIVVREAILSALPQISNKASQDLDLFVSLPKQIILDFNSFTRYKILEDIPEKITGMQFDEFLDVLHKHFSDSFESLNNMTLKIWTVPFIDYMISITTTMTIERFIFMNTICSNPPAYTYVFIDAISRTLYKKKSWIYASIKSLENIGLVTRYENIHPKVSKRKKRIEKIIIPNCMAWKLSPCILELPKYDIRIKMTKPKEFACIRGYKENEVFHEPNKQTLKDYIEILNKSGIKISKKKLDEIIESKYDIIYKTPCPILRYTLEILSDIIIKALSIRDRGIIIKKEKEKEKQEWDLIDLF
ncbi:MAG: hypothetical protein Q6363_006465, partial [Candidatus Njordarchaeota archaeon]